MLEFVCSMPSPVELEYLVLCYAPNPFQGHTDIAIAVFATGNEDFGEIRFLKNWSRVLALDPQADLEALDSLAKDLKEQFRARESRDRMVQLMKNSFSNTIQIPIIRQCTSPDPLSIVEQLEKALLS